MALLLASCTESKPLRSDCIVKVELNWEGNSVDFNYNKSAVISHIVNMSDVEAKLPIAGMQVQDNKDIYYIFHQECNKRFSHIEGLYEHYTHYYPNFPQFEISAQRIEPSISTILVFGDYWRDGNNGHPFNK